MTLQAALTAAQSDGDDDVIIIAPGMYDASGATFTYTAAENFSLTLTGAGSGATILDGGTLTQVMALKTGSPDDLADISVQGMTFQNGKSSAGGGLDITVTDASLALDDVSFFQNGAAVGGGAELRTTSGAISLTNSNFDSNAQAFIGAGADIGSTSGAITLKGNQFTGNSSNVIAGGADVFSLSGAVSLDGNLFVGNSSNNINGGASIGSGGTVTFTNNIVSGNSSITSVGGIEISLQVGGSTVAVINNTITGNTAGTDAGGLEVLLSDNASVGNIYNNIIWGNTAAGNGADIFVNDDGDGDNTGSVVNLFNNDFTTLFFTCVSPGCTPNENQGANLSDQDPLFVNAAAQDFHLGLGSPVIDQGLSSAPSLPATDFDGNPRVIGIAPDMGAFETLPNITLSPTRNDYGNIAVGTSAGAIFTITSNGVASLLITGMTLSDTTNFSLDVNGGSAPCGSLTPTIATGGSCTVLVNFNPQVGGAINAILTISSDDPDSPTVQASLTGFGVAIPNGQISGSGCSLTGGSPSATFPLILFLNIPFLIAMKRISKTE